jgi:uncharacterized BrkB/YihY/UPF0761 family membrane protein
MYDSTFVLGVLGVALFVGVVSTALWIWSLVDAARFSEREYADAGQNKWVWMVILFFLWPVASAVFLFWPRPDLKRARLVGDGGRIQ